MEKSFRNHTFMGLFHLHLAAFKSKFPFLCQPLFYYSCMYDLQYLMPLKQLTVHYAY